MVVDRIDDTARFAALARTVADQARAAGQARAVGQATLAGQDSAGVPAELRSELLRYQQVYNIRVGVFYRDGSALVAAPKDWTVPDELLARQAFNEALDGRRSHDPPQVWPWERNRLVVASPIVRDGDVVAVVLTDSPTGQMRSRILRSWLLVGAGEAVAMLLGVVLAFRLTGWVLRPVRVLDRVTHDIATGRLHSRVAPAGGPPELRRLAGSFNDMADNVEAALERQRSFVADASHQLRNPLSALLLRVEVLGMDLPDGHQDELDRVRAEGRRLTQVVDDLLALALAENAVPDLRLVDVAELAAERVLAWRVLAERSGVDLVYRGSGAATGWADPTALSSALDAVVDNAVKFTGAGQKVQVGVVARGGSVLVTVTDFGPGLNPEELRRVGDRFWRSARHQNVSGSGLGLAVSRALLAPGGGSLSFAAGSPTGLVVTITVPRGGTQGLTER